MDIQSNHRDEWWGFSLEFGWVVLDRSIMENQPSSPTNLLFVKCSDWSVYEEKRANWEEPNYFFEKKYLSKLSRDESGKATERLMLLKSEYQQRRKNLHNQYSILKHGNKDEIIEKHKIFLARIGKKQGSDNFKSSIDQSRRVAHCYSCKNHLDNIYDLECMQCGWIVCENCGACGCGYY